MDWRRSAQLMVVALADGLRPALGASSASDWRQSLHAWQGQATSRHALSEGQWKWNLVDMQRMRIRVGLRPSGAA